MALTCNADVQLTSSALTAAASGRYAPIRRPAYPRLLTGAERFTQFSYGGSGSVLESENLALQLIRGIYGIESPDVAACVRRQDHVAAVLLEAPAHVARWFGPDASLRVRVLNDYEGTDENEPVLMVAIITTLPIVEALRRLDHFDEHWFLGQVDRTAGRLNFTVESL